MSTDTATLDERLREQSRAEVKKEMFDLMAPLYKAVSDWPTLVWTVERNGKVVQLQSYDVLEILRKHLIACACPKREQKAIDAFVAKVDSLQDQIDEVRELTGV